MTYITLPNSEMLLTLFMFVIHKGGVTALTCESLLNLSNAPVPHLTAVNVPSDLPSQSTVAPSLPQSVRNTPMVRCSFITADDTFLPP